MCVFRVNKWWSNGKICVNIEHWHILNNPIDIFSKTRLTQKYTLMYTNFTTQSNFIVTAKQQKQSKQQNN